jgi:Tol biopolymer transport system component
MDRPTMRIGLAIAVAALGVGASTGPVEARGAHAFDLVSQSPAGDPADGRSLHAVVNAGGRFVAFESVASNLVRGDGNPATDVFRWDARIDRTILVSRTASGGSTNGHASRPSISANGRYIAYTSTATNINGPLDDISPDVYRYDTVLRKTILISRPSDHRGGDGGADDASISGDGQLVVFDSDSERPGDTNGESDVFLYDVASGKTERVSLTHSGRQWRRESVDPDISRNGRFVVYMHSGPSHRQIIRVNVRTGKSILVSRSSSGQAGDADSKRPAVSGDGRFIVYSSLARNLVANDAKRHQDVFLFDAKTGMTSLISKAMGGGPANAGSDNADISGDGDHIVFESKATNLSSDPTGGHRNIFEQYVPSGTNVLYSESLGAGAPNGASFSPAVSANGFAVVFQSSASNIVAGDTHGVDVFRRTLA